MPAHYPPNQSPSPQFKPITGDFAAALRSDRVWVVWTSNSHIQHPIQTFMRTLPGPRAAGVPATGATVPTAFRCATGVDASRSYSSRSASWAGSTVRLSFARTARLDWANGGNGDSGRPPGSACCGVGTRR